MSFQLNSRDPFVTKWKKFLNIEGYDCGTPSQLFDIPTDAATKIFQSDHGLKPDGVVGPVTIGVASTLGFNQYGEPAFKQIKRTTELLYWIEHYLGGDIRTAIAGTIYTEDWLGAMVARETGFLITQYVNKGLPVEAITPMMKGDWSLRKGETKKQYHGYGYWQIDVASYPQFIQSGDWTNVLKTAKKAVAVLEEKRKYLQPKFGNKLSAMDMERAITAAYNCGQGNVEKALNKGLDVDYYTFSQDYSKQVFEYRKKYLNV